MPTGSAPPLDAFLAPAERRDARRKRPAPGASFTLPLLTVREVAALLRCADKTVRAAIQRGDLVAELHGGRLLIDARELASYRHARRTSPPRPAVPTRTPRHEPGGRNVTTASLEHLEAIESEVTARCGA